MMRERVGNGLRLCVVCVGDGGGQLLLSALQLFMAQLLPATPALQPFIPARRPPIAVTPVSSGLIAMSVLCVRVHVVGVCWS